MFILGMIYERGLVILYIFVVLTVLYYFIQKVHERFENIAVMDEAKCMSCMTYFRDVFQFTDPSKIVPYINKRTDFLVYVLRQFQDFIQFSYKKCIADIPEDEVKISDMIKCFTKVVEEFQKECANDGKTSASECAVIQTLGDKIIRQSLMCGAKDCTMDEFRKRFEDEIKSMAQDLRACAEGFVNDTSLCTRMYAKVIMTKNQQLTSNEEEKSTPVTQKQMNEKLGEMTAFIMMN